MTTYVEQRTLSVARARQMAFDILSSHGDCLADDTVLDDLIEDIAIKFMELESEGFCRGMNRVESIVSDVIGQS